MTSFFTYSIPFDAIALGFKENSSSNYGIIRTQCEANVRSVWHKHHTLNNVIIGVDMGQATQCNKEALEMHIPNIDCSDLTANYDAERHLVWVVYIGAMTAKMTIAVYKWTAELGSHIAVSEVRGAIYDFRQVTDFSGYSLSTVQRESRSLNVNLDMSHIPVALIVENEIQRHMIEIGLKLTPQEHRKRVVYSEDQALAFFDQWHAELDLGAS